MKIFLDTANLQDIKNWHQTGLIDGVTTNPTHLSKEGGDPKELVKQICEVMKDGDISVEITEIEPEKVYAQAKEIAKIADNVVVKIPCHKDYYEIIKKLAQENIPLNITLIFTPLQGLFMCKLGVKYISPFIGRLNDIEQDGIELVNNLRIIIDANKFTKTEIIAASIRDASVFQDALMYGANIATVPVNVLEEATKHTLTDSGMKKFLDDWKKLGIKQFP
jgi:transaldolase